MIYIALVCSLAAFLSGLLAIGSGKDWHFSTRDIARGRENAIAYIWVTLSTIFSISHSAVIGFWIWIGGPAIVGEQHTTMWMSFHAAMGLLFLTAHLFIKAKIENSRDRAPSYLWGNG